jgi:GDP-D-mannose 3',5'-epimerase
MRSKSKRTALVAGGGGFIGGHLVQSLLARGYGQVRSVDLKPFDEWYQFHERAENLVLDLRDLAACRRAVDGVDEVFNLAADMGGMGFIENNKALCMISVLINTHLLLATKEAGRVSRYFYASSACVYNGDKQRDSEVTALVEEDAYPALAEDGYGWEKLFSERMCRHFREDFGLQTRIARFHNVYGPVGTFEGGREKAPAAMCRKVIEAQLSGRHQIEIWGDGEQTRSFMYIDDCLEGIQRIHEGHCVEPLNLGSSELVSINRLVDLVEEVAGIRLERHYDLSAPKGVRGRNSDNTRIRREYGWEPSIPLRTGIERTYRWIYDQVIQRYGAALPAPQSNRPAPAPWHVSSSSTSTTGRTSQVPANT